jgi:hypothetical protein
MLSTQLSAEDQTLLDQMRSDDAGSPGAPPAPEPGNEGALEPGQPGSEPVKTEKPKQTVPLATLLEEREERKRFERELAEERRARQTLDERTNLILQRMQQPAAEKPAEAVVPELEKDPVGHLVGRLSAAERQAQQAAQQAAQNAQQQQQAWQAQQVQQAIVERAQGLEAEFQIEHEDYPAAVQFLMKKRGEELAVIGQEAAQRAASIKQEGFALAVHAMQNNRNPAALLYELARMRGYAPAATEPPASPQVPAAGERLQNLAAGQRQARSLSDTRGSGPAPLTANALLQMSEQEFDKMINTPEGMALLGKGG